MNTMIKSVEKAINDAIFAQDQDYQMDYGPAARAAFAATENPTPAMIEAGEAAIKSGANALGVWRHMHYYATHEFPITERREQLPPRSKSPPP